MSKQYMDHLKRGDAPRAAHRMGADRDHSPQPKNARTQCAKPDPPHQPPAGIAKSKLCALAPRWTQVNPMRTRIFRLNESPRTKTQL
jgi:hypothetical protein